jgi:hypothetical protein
MMLNSRQETKIRTKTETLTEEESSVSKPSEQRSELVAGAVVETAVAAPEVEVEVGCDSRTILVGAEVVTPRGVSAGVARTSNAGAVSLRRD